MGTSSSKGSDPRGHRQSSDRSRTDLHGHTIADLMWLSEGHQTSCKSVDDGAEATGNATGRRVFESGDSIGVSGDQNRQSRGSQNYDSEYPESISDGRSDDTMGLSTLLSDPAPLPSKARAHFVNPNTREADSKQNQVGPRVRACHLYPNDRSYDSLSPNDLISKWWKSEVPIQRNNIRQCILTITIPRLESSQKFADISSFLKIDDKAVCVKVYTTLLKFLYSSEYDLNVGHILDIELNVWNKLRLLQDRVFDLGLINILLWSYLLCHPGIQEKYGEEIIYRSKERKKSIQDFRREKQSTASEDLFKAMQSFHEDFPERFDKRGGLSLGKDVLNTCDKRDEETLNLVEKAKFCDKIAHLYSLMKQIIATEHDCDNIVTYLKHIHPSLIGRGRSGKTLTLTTLLCQGCNHALQTVFCQAEVQVGPVKRTTKKDLQELIGTAIVQLAKKRSISSLLCCLNIPKYKMCHENRLRYMLQEFSSLIFHPAKCVRDPIHAILCQYNPQCIPQLYISEIERNQVNCDLRINSSDRETDTYFQTLKGRMGNHKVIIHAHKPSFDKLHSSDAGYQVPPKQKSERDRHINNLNMLLKIKIHPNIVELFAYQAKPLPWYYIVEDCQQTTLQEMLLQKRMSNNWVSDKRLCDYLLDIVNGLSALHRQNVLLRDLTLNNFFLVNDKVVKIGDLSLACVYKSKNDTPVRDLYPEGIPTRWTSPEALLDGTFSPQSDIWSIGLVIYAMWTHGCDPFTEHYGADTEEVMRKVVFEELLPFQWPCIPDKLNVLMRQCMRADQDARIHLNVFKDDVDKYLKTLDKPQIYSDTSETTFEAINERDRYYPLPDNRQIERHHVPERGIPEFVHKFRKEKNEGFVNTSRRDWIWTIPVVSPTDLRSSDDLIFVSSEDGLTVKEPLTEEFVKKRLPHIEASGIKSLDTGPATLEKNGHGYYTQERIYEPSETLLDAALHRIHDFDGVYFLMGLDINPYLHSCLQVAESIQDMHKKGWIHRNLRAKNFLVNKKTREVYTCRIGRMIQIPVSETGTEIVQERVFKESSRWLPPEVLINGIYSKAGDVYMIAMMIYEVLQAYQEDYPRRDMVSVPYCLVPQQKLAMEKQNGHYLPKPDCCPEDLYNFLVRCWNPDRCERPSIEIVVWKLRQSLGAEIQLHKERLRRKDELPTSPATSGPSGQPRRIDGRSHFSRIRRFGKTVKRLLTRTKRAREPEASNDYQNTQTDHIYASVNGGFDWEDVNEALYLKLETSQSADGDEVIYDRLGSEKNTWSRTNVFRHDVNVSSNNDNGTDNPGLPVPMRSKRGRRKELKKRKKSRYSVNNHTSSTESSHLTTRRRRSKARSRVTWMLQPHVFESLDNDVGHAQNPFQSDDVEQSDMEFRESSQTHNDFDRGRRDESCDTAVQGCSPIAPNEESERKYFIPSTREGDLSVNHDPGGRAWKGGPRTELRMKDREKIRSSVLKGTEAARGGEQWRNRGEPLDFREGRRDIEGGAPEMGVGSMFIDQNRRVEGGPERERREGINRHSNCETKPGQRKREPRTANETKDTKDSGHFRESIANKSSEEVSSDEIPLAKNSSHPLQESDIDIDASRPMFRRSRRLNNQSFTNHHHIQKPIQTEDATYLTPIGISSFE